MPDIEFFGGLLEITGVNIVLSGDNALVIALASRSLPPHQQRTAIVLGSAGAILLRIALTVLAVELLQLPWLRLAGGALLLWVGIRMLLDDPDPDASVTGSTSGLWIAIRTILIADLVMSLDNVLGVAAAAHGNITLLILGLAISIPLIVFGSALLLKIMVRFPIVITLGAGLIGYVAGEMLVDEPVIESVLPVRDALVHYGLPVLGALIVVLVGHAIAAYSRSRDQEVTDIEPTEQTREQR
jgi:YjbE family integral membrane protein